MVDVPKTSRQRLIDCPADLLAENSRELQAFVCPNCLLAENVGGIHPAVGRIQCAASRSDAWVRRGIFNGRSATKDLLAH